MFLDDKDINDQLENTREKIENSICHRLIGLCMAFHELIQSAFPEGACADNITRVS